MQYKLSNDFTALSETSGIFYVMPGQSVELAVGSSTPAKDSGFVLHGGVSFPLSSEKTVYARSRGGHATLNVTEAELAIGIAGITGSSGQGGDIGPDDAGEITQADIDSLFGGNGTEGITQADIDSLFGGNGG